jgi:anti-sigma regulatory factor (Ser/Thr protein kinase)
VIQDDDRKLIAVITDQGPGLPTQAAPTRPDVEAAGGRGLWLIQQVCDRVEVQSGRTGTRVRLEMDLHSG